MAGVLDKSPEVIKGDTVVISRVENSDDSYALKVESVRGEQVTAKSSLSRISKDTERKLLHNVMYSGDLNIRQF